VPEHQRGGVPEHEPYELLCALAAGGLLEGADFVEFQTHMRECSECLSDYLELSNVVSGELLQTQGKFQQKLAEMRAKPLPYSRQRFLRRARAEGVVFSAEVETPAKSKPWYFRPVTLLAPFAALVLLAVSLRFYYFRQTPDTARAMDAAGAQQMAELKRENTALTANLSRLNESLAAAQRETQDLRAQLKTTSTTAETLRRNSEQSSGTLSS